MRPFLKIAPCLVAVWPALAQQAPLPPALVALFAEWRAFQKPRLVDGVPDYRPAAMAEQERWLKGYQAKVKALDAKDWPIPAQVDKEILRAEMAGLEFDHRVLRPWANNPAFYVTVLADQSDQPAPEGPLAEGTVELWRCASPLSAADVARIRPGLRAIPGLLAQAQGNLVGHGRDLWAFGAKSLHTQAEELAKLVASLGKDADPAFRQEVVQAQAATEKLAAWVVAQAPKKTGPSGIGVANYDWYLKHVQLLPHTWRDEVQFMEQELARSKALLAMEEQRNAQLPQLVPVATAEEHAKAFKEAVPRYMAFLRDHHLMSLPDYLEPALQAKVGAFAPGPREFFSEVDYRDPVVMRTHGFHWFDLARMAHEPHPDPVRRGPLLYNLFNTRTEGHATAWEELMMQAGLVDGRSRELIYILVAQRAARGLASLRMHSGEFTLEQAAAFACANTPRGWLRLSGGLVRAEQHLYLQQPGYGTSYLCGKAELEKLLAERRDQLGERFSFQAHMDEFLAAGLIPASLLRWELEGRMPDDVRKMLAEP